MEKEVQYLYVNKKGEVIVNKNDFKNRLNKKDLTPVIYEPDIVVTENINDYKKGIDKWMEAFYKIGNILNMSTN